MSCAPPNLPAEVEQVREKIHTLRKSPSLKGIHCLCNDGVLRSFSSSKAIIDVLPLSEQEIQHFIYLYPEDIREMVYEVFRGVDGHRVPQEKLLCPDDEVLPENLRGTPRNAV